MKLFKMFLSALLGMCFVQCDTAERRKNKAEDVIEKHLFETIDNYQSYEKISTEVDTLRDLWMANSDIIALADELYTVNDDLEKVEEGLAEMKAKVERSIRQIVYRGNSQAWIEILSNRSEWEARRKQLDENKQILDSIHASISERIYTMVYSLEMPKKPYWHVTQKFRISENGQDTKIHFAHYIFDPKMKEIIFSWDENDYRVNRLIHIVNDFAQEEFFDAVTEDEEEL